MRSRVCLISLLALVATARCEDMETWERAPETEDRNLPDLLPIFDREYVDMPSDRLQAALTWATKKIEDYKEIEKNMPQKKNRHSYRHFRRATDEEQLRKGREALVWVEAARAPKDLKVMSTNVRNITCPEPPQYNCDFSQPFRRMDGACNNLFFRGRGASDTEFVRYAPNTYDDGIHEPRSRSVTGRPLRSPRAITSVVTGERDVENTALTLSTVNFGQFMDHDLTLTPIFLAEPGVELNCCENGVLVENPHPQCLPIDIPENDPFYSQHGERCMEFARSMPSIPDGCRPGPAIQQNVLTAFIDGSGIYGSRDSRAALLRANSSGLLAIQGDNLLPPDPAGVQIDTETPCFSEDHECMVAGDVRANEQSGLTVMHTIWMREHNRIAQGLAAAHSDWDDEQLFQQARKIVGAELQHITYNEWLPIILGEEYMERQRIQTTSGSGYSRRYSFLVNPTIATEFSSAAFRFGHTLIQGRLMLYNTLSNPPPPSTSLAVDLRQVFFNPDLIYAGRLDQFAIGMLTQHPQFCDSNFAADLTEHLFQESAHPFGLDLIALNLQRGREHGIPTYNTMREACGLGRARKFKDLKTTIPKKVVKKLRRVYDHVDDIDLFIGAVSERPAPGAVIGPTMQCIVGDQFTRLRWGDNFFYDLGGLRPWRFSLAQLQEIKKASWARVLCDNIGSITSIQSSAFRAVSDQNPITACSSLPSVDLTQF